jgi:hypothetical protein
LGASIFLRQKNGIKKHMLFFSSQSPARLEV